MYYHQNAGQSHDILVVNKTFDNVANVEYLGTTETKIAFTKELRVDEIQGILATIPTRILCLPISFTLKHIKL
jgi:hypothetical protein